MLYGTELLSKMVRDEIRKISRLIIVNLVEARRMVWNRSECGFVRGYGCEFCAGDEPQNEKML